MSPKSTPAWHTTDDDSPVSVKIVSESAAPTPTEMHRLHAETLPAMQKPSMTMPAILGISVVLAGLGWYFDLGSVLLGNIGGTAEKTVTITAKGEFDPDEIEVHPGDKVTIVNSHEDPQALEPVDLELFDDVQLIFEDPFTFTVPADAAGDYEYLSRTLPEDRSVLFHVTPQIEVGATESTPSTVVSDGLPIPIPFGTDDIEASDPIPEPETEAVITAHQNDTAMISIGGSAQSAEPKTPAKKSSAKIAVNPYTVGATGADQIRAGAVAAAQGEQLHSGAPLAQYADYRPPVTTSTGPEHTAVVVLLLSGLLFVPFARRMLRI